MKVGYIQFNPVFGNKEHNLSQIIRLIRNHADAELLVLPELCTTGYFFTEQAELQNMAEYVPSGSSVKLLEKVAAETDTYLVAGFCEKVSENEFYNSAILLGPEGFIDVYRKIHLFNTEKNFFTPGKGPIQVYAVKDVKIGIIVCFDWAFPELTRILALKGAEIICHPANLVLPFAQKTMLARSIENRVFTITANRIGTEKKGDKELTFTGLSQITSPSMELLSHSSKDEEECRVVDIDPSLARNKWITKKNHIFQDRRTDLYKALLQS